MVLKIDENSPVGLRLAYRLWIELGRPTKFKNRRTLEQWAPKIESLFRRSGLDYAGFKWFLIWALRPDDPDGAHYGNDFTAQNLRAAHDPMASFAKQFNMTFHEIFLPKADKVIPLLVARREEEEAEARHRDAAEPSAKWADILPDDAEPWEREKARHMDRVEARFPLPGRLVGEKLDDWIDREFEAVRDPDWRCPECTYGFSLDGEEPERTKWCPDCAEERRMYEDEDKEWMCGEVASVSCLTKEWE